MASDEETKMKNNRKCACKGVRTCKICEDLGKKPFIKEEHHTTTKLWYCKDCQKAWNVKGTHPNHCGNSMDFNGIYILDNFISEEKEKCIVKEIYKTSFVNSQSGRRKQDYGPKVNFKRRKVKTGSFTGLPDFSADLFQQMKNLDILSDFLPAEQCHLEYDPERGSAIDPHFDDFWLWGERLVTINLLSDTVLYFICDEMPDIEVCVPMRQRSLVVVYGEARHKWKHAIHRSDVTQTRLAVTLRELSEEFLETGSRASEGQDLLDIALTFNGLAVGS